MITKFNCILFIFVLFLQCGLQKKKQTVDIHHWLQTANIYEISVPLFSETQNFSGILKSKNHFQKLFINTLALLPICPREKGKEAYNPGNLYALDDFKTIDPALGTKKDFTRFIDSFHQMNIKIFLEFDVSFTGINHAWRKNNANYYLSAEPMKDGNYNQEYVKLNLSNTELQNEFLLILSKWVNDFDLDGLLLYGTKTAPKEFIQKIIEDIGSTNNVFIITDHESENFINRNSKYGVIRNDLYSAFDKASVDSLSTDFFVAYFKKLKQDTNAIPVCFSHNFKKDFYEGSLTTKFYNSYKMFATLCNTLPGVPMMFNGQEEPMFTKLNTLELKPIHFQYLYSLSMYRTLNIYRQDNPALSPTKLESIPTMISNSKNVLAFERVYRNQTMVVLANLTSSNQEFTIEKDYLLYNELFSGTLVNFAKNTPFSFGPYQYVILTKKIK